jgi:nicotinamide phosphoribosyltransferase
MSALHQKDSYKIDHRQQYAPGTSLIYSNFTARSNKNANVPGDAVTFIGLQHFIMDYLINEWNDSFFNKPKESVVKKYQRRVSNILGYTVNVDHIYALHDLGYLPVKIKALPEGSQVPYGVPMFTIVNTLPEFFWVTNMLESVISAELWQPITSATTYMAYKRLAHRYADVTGADKSFIPFQLHDFSFRGMAGRHAAAISGFAALAAGSFGTDCIPAIDIAEDFYDANSDQEIVGVSVPATEHSVMCSGTKEEEFETYKRLITELYPTGIVSIVSDTWDFWQVVTDYLPKLKNEIMSRDGKVVIRPDSGDPVDIICGTNGLEGGQQPAQKGLIECLWDIFGGTVNEKGYKVLDPHIGAIYGDSITYDRAEQIFNRLAVKGFASSNIVLGIGSYTYQYVTRDTHGMAMKSTYAVINGVGTPIFKDPKTDSGIKKSAKGLLMVSRIGNKYQLEDNVDTKQEKHGCLETVFEDGKLVKRTSLQEIRALTNEGF